MIPWLILKNCLAAGDLLADYYRILDWAAGVMMEIGMGTGIDGGRDDDFITCEDRAQPPFPFPFSPFFATRRNRITRWTRGDDDYEHACFS